MALVAVGIVGGFALVAASLLALAPAERFHKGTAGAIWRKAVLFLLYAIGFGTWLALANATDL
jgi:hypothetical protein